MLHIAPLKSHYVIKRILSDELCRTACCYLRMKADIGEMQLGDSHVPNAFAAYGDVMMETLLKHMQPRVEEEIGYSLLPTHSYARIYQTGSRLTPHKDRVACEVSVTITLGNELSEPWPIFLNTPDGVQCVILQPGDGLIYPGADFTHWREPFMGSWQTQLTLHYVDSNGPHSVWRFDKRPSLGCHKGTRRV